MEFHHDSTEEPAQSFGSRVTWKRDGSVWDGNNGNTGDDTAIQSGSSGYFNEEVESMGDGVTTSSQAVAAAATLAVSMAGASRLEGVFPSWSNCESLLLSDLQLYTTEGDSVAREAIASAELLGSERIGSSRSEVDVLLSIDGPCSARDQNNVAAYYAGETDHWHIESTVLDVRISAHSHGIQSLVTMETADTKPQSKMLFDSREILQRAKPVHACAESQSTDASELADDMNSNDRPTEIVSKMMSAGAVQKVLDTAVQLNGAVKLRANADLCVDAHSDFVYGDFWPDPPDILEHATNIMTCERLLKEQENTAELKRSGDSLCTESKNGGNVSISVVSELGVNGQLDEVAGSTGGEAATPGQAVAAAATVAVSSAGASRPECIFSSWCNLESSALSGSQLYTTDEYHVAFTAVASAELSCSERIGSSTNEKSNWVKSFVVHADKMEPCYDDPPTFWFLPPSSESTAETTPSAAESPVVLESDLVQVLQLGQQPFDPGGEPMTSSMQHEMDNNDLQDSNPKGSLPRTETKHREHRASLKRSPTFPLVAYADIAGCQPSGRSKGRPTSPGPGGGVRLRSHLIAADIVCILVLMLLAVQCKGLAIEFAGVRMAPGESRVPGLEQY